MFSYFRKRKEREEAKAKREENLEKQRGEVERAMLFKLECDMLTRPCAMNNMENCTSDCVHFAHGRVSRYPFYSHSRLGTKLHWVRKDPRCKLWK